MAKRKFKVDVRTRARSQRAQATRMMEKRKFKVDVRDGKFVFVPEQPWVYLPADSVEWVSETGRMTVLIGGHVEYPSPFDQYRESKDPLEQEKRRKELKGRRFETAEKDQGAWKTRKVTVQNVFPPRQQLYRRLAAVGSLQYDFTFEVIEEGTQIVYVKTVRGMGSMC